VGSRKGALVVTRSGRQNSHAIASMQKLVIILAGFVSAARGWQVVDELQDGIASSNQDRHVAARGEATAAKALASFLLVGNPVVTAQGASRSRVPKRSILRPRMQRSAGSESEVIDGVRIGPPPDLPSLLLKNRIVYVGAPLVPEVTELVVAELLYLSSEKPDDIYMYINSPGSPSTYDAFAITDTMDYIKPDVHTICVGTAFGTAAMVLANGAKGKRTCLPNAKVMLNQPGGQSQGQAVDIEISAREVLNSRKMILDLLSKRTNQTVETLKADSSRTKYFTADGAKEYGLVDKVLKKEDLPVKPEDIPK